MLARNRACRDCQARSNPRKRRGDALWIRNAAKAYPSPGRLRFDYGSRFELGCDEVLWSCAPTESAPPPPSGWLGFELGCDRVQLDVQCTHLSAFIFTSFAAPTPCAQRTGPVRSNASTCLHAR